MRNAETGPAFSASLIAVALLLPSPVASEIVFPETRNVVGPKEVYALGTFGRWRADCVVDADGFDWCHATRSVQENR